MDLFAAMGIFSRVVESGSFTKAADSLGVSRATVSISIQQLEENFGVRLLYRTTRSVSLTAEGALYYDRAREILAQLESAEQMFHQSPTALSGRLVIDAPTRIARRIIIPALPEFLQRHPQLHISLGASDHSSNLVERGLDAVVRVGPLKEGSYIVKKLGLLSQINCASPRYIARYGRPKTLQDLQAHLLVHYSPSLAAAGTWEYVRQRKMHAIPMQSAIAVDNAETYVAASLAGLGIIQVPTYDVRHHLESGALVSVLPDYVAPPSQVSLVYPSRRHLPERFQVFSAWLTSLFQARSLFEA